MGKVIKGEWKGTEGAEAVEPEKAKKVTKKAKEETTAKIYQLRILLLDSEPEIFRRVLVAGDTPLDTLHRVIQVAMGWTNSHLHEFHIKGVSYGDINMDDGMDMEGGEDESRFSLQEVATRVRSVINYAYDFGDDWEHKITVEKIAEKDERFPGYPVCIEGQHAAPPEDCGGIFGYYENLEVLKDPDHEEYEDVLEWMGGQFDPDGFDIVGVNKELKKIKAKKAR
jgi:hypothetical protein